MKRKNSEVADNKENSSARRPMLGSIERKTLNDQVHGTLKRALLTGQIEAGMTLTFRGLAEDLGTSMMPVREAVARLVAERALEVVPQKGIRVPKLSPEELDDLWSLRMMLESEAAARAAARATDDDVERIRGLRDIVREKAEEGSVHGFLEANNDFQFAIYAAAGTRVFTTQVEMLRLQASPHRNHAIRFILEERPPFFQKMLQNHDELVDAISAHDAERARSVRRADIQGLHIVLEELQGRESRSDKTRGDSAA